MNADLWRDREHQVLVRFTWAGWRYHYRAVRAGGGQVPDLMLDQLLECVAEVQGEWMAEAPDMPPEVPMKPEPNDDC